MFERASTSCSDSPFWRRIERNRSPTIASLMFIPCPSLTPALPEARSPERYHSPPPFSPYVVAIGGQLTAESGHPKGAHESGRGVRRAASTAAPATAAVSARRTWGP